MKKYQIVCAMERKSKNISRNSGIIIFVSQLMLFKELQ